jgi:hypothetical protein
MIRAKRDSPTAVAKADGRLHEGDLPNAGSTTLEPKPVDFSDESEKTALLITYLYIGTNQD